MNERLKYCVLDEGKDGNRDAGSERYTETFLYDLAADPYELTNLIGVESHAEVAGVLRERLRQRMVAAGEAEPHIEPAPSVPAGQRKVSAAATRM